LPFLNFIALGQMKEDIFGALDSARVRHRLLFYDGQILTEVQTFQRYMAEKKAAPKSKAVLLDDYRRGRRLLQPVLPASDQPFS
jgi:hypothetical protein